MKIATVVKFKNVVYVVADTHGDLLLLVSLYLRVRIFQRAHIRQVTVVA